MGLKKAGSTTPAPAAETAKEAAPAQTAPENGAAAAVERLKKGKSEIAGKAATGYAPRDHDKEARGKTRCVQFEAALMSPAIAGMKFDSMEQYLALCRQAADFGTSYTFAEDVPF